MTHYWLSCGLQHTCILNIPVVTIYEETFGSLREYLVVNLYLSNKVALKKKIHKMTWKMKQFIV